MYYVIDTFDTEVDRKASLRDLAKRHKEHPEKELICWDFKKRSIIHYNKLGKCIIPIPDDFRITLIFKGGIYDTLSEAIDV